MSMNIRKLFKDSTRQIVTKGIGVAALLFMGYTASAQQVHKTQKADSSSSTKIVPYSDSTGKSGTKKIYKSHHEYMTKEDSTAGHRNISAPAAKKVVTPEKPKKLMPNKEWVEFLKTHPKWHSPKPKATKPAEIIAPQINTDSLHNSNTVILTKDSTIIETTVHDTTRVPVPLKVEEPKEPWIIGAGYSNGRVYGDKEIDHGPYNGVNIFIASPHFARKGFGHLLNASLIGRFYPGRSLHVDEQDWTVRPELAVVDAHMHNTGKEHSNLQLALNFGEDFVLARFLTLGLHAQGGVDARQSLQYTTDSLLYTTGPLYNPPKAQTRRSNISPFVGAKGDIRFFFTGQPADAKNPAGPFLQFAYNVQKIFRPATNPDPFTGIAADAGNLEQVIDIDLCIPLGGHKKAHNKNTPQQP